MAIFSEFIFVAVKWHARRGLNTDADSLSDVKQDARQRGVRGDVRVLVFAKAWICFCGAELCAAK